MNPGLTLSMIVKNEEAKLSRCLASAKDWVDRIAILDTGSTDRTLEIAQEFGSEIKCIEWPGAFDEARNTALEMIETEWVLVLDADEWLLPESGPQIRKAIENEAAAGYYLLRQDLYNEVDYTEQNMLRLFRNRPDARFLGVIHEQIYPGRLKEATGLSDIPKSEIRFRHDGVATSTTKEKALRYIELTKRELDLRPNSLYYQSNLAFLQVCENIPEGALTLRRVMQTCLDRENDPTAPEMELALAFAAQLNSIVVKDFQANRTNRVVKLAWKWFGDSPFVVAALTEFERKRNNLRGAHNGLVRLAEMAVTGNYSRHRSFDPGIFGVWLWRQLLRTSKMAGDRNMQRLAAERLLQIEPTDQEALAISK